MWPIRGRRACAVGAASAAAHVAVFAALAVYAPKLRPPPPADGPPIQMMPVLLLPKTSRPSVAASRPLAPIRLHRRLEPLAPDTPVAPLIAPPSPPVSAAEPREAASPLPPQSTGGTAQAVLKARVGCTNPDAAGLTREERETCEARLAANAKDAPWLGLGLNTDKRRALDAVVAHKEACRIYRAGGEQPPLRSGLC